MTPIAFAIDPVSVITSRMSRGPGVIEKSIADLFAATRDRALSIEEIARHAFALQKGGRPSRAQRLSATRAAHRLLRRVREMSERADQLTTKARQNTESALGRSDWDEEYRARLDADPAWTESRKLHDAADRIGRWSRIVPAEHRGWLRIEYDFWCTTLVNGRLWFHPPDVPVMVWAVSIQPAGVLWAAAEITKITERNVMVRYAGEIARLDRESLWKSWAVWRGVAFASSRTGRIAARLDELWASRYGGAAGGAPPTLQMPIADAIALLGVPENYTAEDVIKAFRRVAKKAHPDAGGSAEEFRRAVEARDRLLAALGTSAPAPKMPEFAPKGVPLRYRRVRPQSQRLGSGAQRYLS